MPDTPQGHRSEWEAKVTALLLGELPAEEAEAVRRQIAQDPELAKWEAELKLTMGFVRESLQSPEESVAPQAAPVRMSEAKRERLLAHFKTVKVKQPQGAKGGSRRLVFWTSVAAAVAALAAVLTPALQHTRSTSETFAIRNNLRARGGQEAVQSGGQESAPLELRGQASVPTAAPPAGNKTIPIQYAAASDVSDALNKGGIASQSSPAVPEPAIAPPTAGGHDEASQLTAAYKAPVAAAPAPTLGETPALGALFDSGREAGRGGQQTAALASRAAPGGGGGTAQGEPGWVGTLSGEAAPPENRQANMFVGSYGYGDVPTPQLRESNGSASLVGRNEFAENLTPVQVAAPPMTDYVEQLERDKKAAAKDTAGSPDETKTTSNSPAEPSNSYSVNAVGYINVGTNQGTTLTNQVWDSTSKPGALSEADRLDEPLKRAAAHAITPQPEIKTADNPFSTFSLDVRDVSFRLAAAALEKGQMPEPGSVRPEEFLNAFDYRDPEPAPGVKVSFAWERCADPFAHHRDFLRFSLKTAAEGRDGASPLNIVLLLDKSGSMERADRVAITRKMLEALSGQLRASDTISVVVFARTPRLWADGVAGDKAAETLKSVGDITPEGGTDLEAAMRAAYESALRHYLPNGENRVVLLTDGAANLGEVDPASLQKMVETNRAQGVAFDCFGVGWEGYNDELLETLSRAGGGRYGFINRPEDAAADFAGKLAGALRVAAYDVKAQVEFNPGRVTSWRQIGYAKDQLTKEQFRDNSVKAAQLGAAESGNAMYAIEINPAGDGPIATVRVRYRLPGSNEYREQEWPVPYSGRSLFVDNSRPAMRLAATACAFAEWLQNSPYAGQVSLDRLALGLNGVPEAYGADTRPQLLETMIREARSISGK